MDTIKVSSVLNKIHYRLWILYFLIFVSLIIFNKDFIQGILGFLIILMIVIVGILPNLYSFNKFLKLGYKKFESLVYFLPYVLVLLVVNTVVMSIISERNTGSNNSGVFFAIVFGVIAVVIGLIINIIYMYIIGKKKKNNIK